jgi:hypothetical protein
MDAIHALLVSNRAFPGHQCAQVETGAGPSLMEAGPFQMFVQEEQDFETIFRGATTAAKLHGTMVRSAYASPVDQASSPTLVQRHFALFLLAWQGSFGEAIPFSPPAKIVLWELRLQTVG